ncbi:MAG: GGDEF domain-containing protein [Rubrivivax sp.]|nr:MAG: GGDEF domain-containing protein [Rubrivivax sp.]
MTEPHDDAVYRLEALQRQILAAEATLAALQATIIEARSERGVLAAGTARRENERLRAENLVAVQEVETAQAALEVAVKASQTDALTGLHNRDVLWDRLAHDIAVARRHGTRLVVYFMDVDGFKRVNDQFGHAAGDLLLQRVAHVLVTAVRASDTVCRLGGDEFVVLAAAHAPQDALQVAAKIRQALAEPCQVAGQSMSVTASIGYSVFPDDGESPGLLVQKADEAMYRAKRRAAYPHSAG